MSATHIIGPWMLAVGVLGLLLAIAAWGAEWLMVSLARPRRHVWTVALAVAVVWPMVGWFVLTPPADVVDIAATATDGRVNVGALLPSGETMMDAAPLQVGTVLLVMWAMMSLLLLVSTWRALRTLSRETRTAEKLEMQGVPVLRTASLGPAVVGLHRPALMMPAWVWQLDTALQRLVLQHELEHRRAGDAWLVGGGVLATLLMPWNPAVWWMVRRLRLAMEVDCDARTLRAVPQGTSHYAHLLLLMAQRRQAARLVPMLVPTPSQLARRIDAMMHPPSRSTPRRVLAALLIVVASLAACSRHIANNLAGPATPEARTTQAAPEAPTEALTEAAAASASAQGAKTYFDFQTQAPATMRADSRHPIYPADLRAKGVTGSVLAQFVVDASGNVDPSSLKVLRETHAAFTDAVRAAVPGFRFLPAMIDGQAVRQLVQMPFAFEAPASGSNAAAKAAAKAAANAATGAAANAPHGAPQGAPQGGAPQDGAQLLPGSPGPRYPVALREQGVEGVVIAQFVVDTTGDVLPGSFRVLRSPHDDFTAAVREALPKMRFRPARVDGRAVRQLLQEPFAFQLSR